MTKKEFGLYYKPIQKDVFFNSFGTNTRFEVLRSGFNIDKLKMGFQQNHPVTNKQIAYVLIYMDIDKALVLANDILSGKLAAAAKLKQKDDPNGIVTVYKSQGGQSAKDAHRPDGKPLYRELCISKGKLWVLKATSGPGATTDNGGFIPDGKPDATVSIGLSNEALKGFALTFQENYRAFLTVRHMALLMQDNSGNKNDSYGQEMNEQFDFD